MISWITRLFSPAISAQQSELLQHIHNWQQTHHHGLPDALVRGEIQKDMRALERMKIVEKDRALDIWCLTDVER